MRDQQSVEKPEIQIVEQWKLPVEPVQPRRGKLGLVAVTIVVLLIALLVAGYLPRLKRESELAAGLQQQKTTLPQVNAAVATASPSSSDLKLPSNITPITEAVINARAEGYLKRRYVDIGDRVKAGQLMAEVDAPEIDQQVQQARATLSQVEAALARAQHALAQSKANEHLSDVTAQRWKTLADRGVVSKQEYDQRQAQFDSDQAAVEAAQADIRAAEDNIRASRANLDRLIQLQAYEKITAPFAGIVTARNVDVGALIATTGNTPLFRVAQINVLRVMVDVPEQSAPYIKVGEPAELSLQEFGDRKFIGHVSRTANSLDPTSRTLLTEVQVQNGDQVLLPNMFANVKLIGARNGAAIMIPGEAIVARPEGTLVAKIVNGNHIHFQPVELGRDYGARIEIVSGIAAGDRVVVNPTDDVREGAVVNPMMQKAPAQAGAKK
jgi:RND family efflux transporter MFP subunit